MAVFGVPALARGRRAARGAGGLGDARPPSASWGLRRASASTPGRSSRATGDTLVTGDAVNVAAHLEQAADPGEVLIGPETHRHVRDAAVVEPVRGDGQREAGADRGSPSARARPGGERRCPQARHAARRSASGSCALLRRRPTSATAREKLLSPLHPARPCRRGEVTARRRACSPASRRTIVRGRCLDYGDGITYWPVDRRAEAARRRERGRRDRAPGLSARDELFLTVRHALEDARAGRPLVVVFEDIHWGEPTFLDLLDHISDLSRDAPILLLCVARPELLDDRPGWGGGKLNATSALLLEPLTAAESNALLDAARRRRGGRRASRARIVRDCRRAIRCSSRRCSRCVARRRRRSACRRRSRPSSQARLDRLGARGAGGDRTRRGRGRALPSRRRAGSSQRRRGEGSTRTWSASCARS